MVVVPTSPAENNNSKERVRSSDIYIASANTIMIEPPA